MTDDRPISDDHATRVQPAPATGEGPAIARERLIVVGITGKARSGKDTTAGILTTFRGCHRIALADGVRSAFDELSGPTKELHKELGGEMTYRRTLQTLGTECREAANALGLWVHLLLAKIRFLSAHWPNPRNRFVIPDIRFRREVSMVRHQVQLWGGSYGTLRLTHPGGPAIAEADHVSETELDTIRADREYENAGTVEDLASAAVGFFDDVAAGRVSGSF